MKKPRVKLGIILIILLLLSFLLQYKINHIDGELHLAHFQERGVISTLIMMAHYVQHYYITNGKYPTKLSKDAFAQYGLKITDPWNNMYIYETDNIMFKLLSRGPDGIKGTNDDIEIQQERPNISIKGIEEWENKIKIDSSHKKRLIKIFQGYLIFIFVFVIWAAWSFILTFNLKLRWQILAIIGVIFIFSLPAIFLPRW